MDEADEVWEQVAEVLETFVDAWEDGTAPPCPNQYAPREPRLRRLALIELIKIDLEYRWQQQSDVLSLDDYASQIDDFSAADDMPTDLIYEEYNLRRRGGEKVNPGEYFKRFPKQADQLRQLLGLNSPSVTRSMGMAARPTNLQPGDTVDDFDLLAELGSGAFASVYLARQRSLQRIVALKVSRNQGMEPQTLAQLDHPHIGRVYDQRVLESEDLRLLYMKYVPGGTLQGAIARSREERANEQLLSGATILSAVDGALDRRGEEPPLESEARTSLAECEWPDAVCRIGIQLANALEYAHERNVLHRDLKPANILLSAEGSPQLVDFNVSFCSTLDGATATAFFGGSLAYMSPEQLEASHPGLGVDPDAMDGRSDLYSLAVVLWEMLVGQRPFKDPKFNGDWPTTLQQMIDTRKKGPDADEIVVGSNAKLAPLRDLLLRCLSYDRDSRPSGGAEMAAELKLCLQPDAYRLLRPAKNSFAHTARRWSITALLVLAMTPNVLAGWFNFVYNRDHIVATLQDSQDVFWNVQFVINSIAYPLGVILLGASYWSVARAARGLASISSERATRLRGRCLNLGQTSAIISAAEWAVAGFAYPISMNAAGANLGPGDYVHFLISLVLCGIIAATYPFFGVTAYSLHFLYPALLSSDRDAGVELKRLRQLERKVWFFLALGFLLPMLGVVLVVVFATEKFRFALTILSLGSLIGCCGLSWAARKIQFDLTSLRNALS